MTTAHTRQVRMNENMEFFACYWLNDRLYGRRSFKPVDASANWENEVWQIGHMDANGNIYIQTPTRA